MAALRKRVVVTGMGAVTPVGVGVRPMWEALLKGQSGVAPITLYDHARHEVHIAAEIKNWAPENHMEKRDARRMDRFCQFGVAAGLEAIADSKLDFSKEDTARAGVIMGTGIGGVLTLEEQRDILNARGPSRVTPFLVPRVMANAAAGHLSIYHKLRGPNFCIVTACAAGANSLGSALRLIQYGEADIMVAGGAEAVITPLVMAGFANMGALSKRNAEPQAASRPFDQERDGFVMGEGAGALVLEELGHALKRDARIYAEFAGYGLSGDGHHITAPCEDGDGGIRSMQGALADAGLDAGEIDYLNAHGTSTLLNDRVETLAVKKVFGERAHKLPISGTKSMTGHTLGAGGAIEAAVTVLSIVEERIHATLNLTHPDPECDLDYVPAGVRPLKIRAALSNSLGFGGHNATLCFSKLKL